MKRRTFFGTPLSAIAFGSLHTDTAAAAEKAPGPPPLEPLVWPVVAKLPPGIRSFAGHTDTVPDIVGRIGTPASLVIFTEGNHLMVLLSDDIVGAFPADSHPPIIYPVAATATAKPEATDYLAFLRSSAAKTIFEKYGFTFLIRPTS